MTYLITSSHRRRLLVYASTAFFLTSLYLCITRLFAITYHPLPPPPKGYTADGKIIVITDNKGALINHDGKVIVTPDGKIYDDGDDSLIGFKKTPSNKDPFSHLEIQLSRADAPMSYDAFARPAYDGITLMRPLPAELVPTYQNRRRLIVIGDIHGLIKPLNNLLDEVEFDQERDHVISVGDMVNKGPDNSGVVGRLLEIKASAVRGNHEDRVLLAWANANSRVGVDASLDSKTAEAHRGESGDLKTARSLPLEHIKWLQSLPAIINVEPLNIYIAHAGLVPGVSIEQQDPWAVMNMRTLRWPREEFRHREEERMKKEEEKKRKKQEEERLKAEEAERAKKEKQQRSEPIINTGQLNRRDHFYPETDAEYPAADDTPTDLPAPDHDIWTVSESSDGEPWTKLWDREELLRPKEQRRTVVYGHNAKRGYHEAAYSFGLDSACIKGGALSAFIIEAAQDGTWTHSTVQVPCSF